MSRHDFRALFDRYPGVIEQMPGTFTSHQFILRLAQQNQDLYVEALFTYREMTRAETPAPFKSVHGILARHLSAFPDLVRQIGPGPSVDIFGDVTGCMHWRKV